MKNILHHELFEVPCCCMRHFLVHIHCYMFFYQTHNKVQIFCYNVFCMVAYIFHHELFEVFCCHMQQFLVYIHWHMFFHQIHNKDHIGGGSAYFCRVLPKKSVLEMDEEWRIFRKSQIEFAFTYLYICYKTSYSS